MKRRNGQLALPIEPSIDDQPILLDWDVIVLNSSGGKDSQTMIREVVRQADEQGVSRDRLVVIHAVLGRVEWPGTLELAKEQAEAYGLEFQTEERKQDDLLEHVEKRGKWPSPRNRYCTSDHKRGPLQKLIRRLGKERRVGNNSIRLLNCMAMRAEESANRRKMKPYTINTDLTALPIAKRTVWDWLPIHHWTEEEVWESVHESGVRYHWAYDLGMPRLSCRFCIFAPKAALVLAGKHNPELLKEYAELEERIGYKFRLDTTMADIQAAVKNDVPVGELDGKWNM